MKDTLLVAIGGGFGSVAPYFASRFSAAGRRHAALFLVVLASALIGALIAAMAIIWTIFEYRPSLPLFIGVGFAGSAAPMTMLIYASGVGTIGTRPGETDHPRLPRALGLLTGTFIMAVGAAVMAYLGVRIGITVYRKL